MTLNQLLDAGLISEDDDVQIIRITEDSIDSKYLGTDYIPSEYYELTILQLFYNDTELLDKEWRIII